jgi:hypothetical protein
MDTEGTLSNARTNKSSFSNKKISKAKTIHFECSKQKK